MPTTIAIVDDSPAIRKLIRAFIESHTDWQVCGEAEDGDTAIVLAKCLHPDLIVLDLVMPGKNGLDAARTITSESPNSEIVLFTAHTSKQLTIEAKQIGIRMVLSKNSTASLEQLLSILRQIRRWPRAA
jgi:DNA-binding NarL/FixJ family response regulator